MHAELSVEQELILQLRRVQPRNVCIKPYLQRLPGAQVHRNVAAVVDPSPRYAGALVTGHDFLGHRPGHRRHRGDEVIGKGLAGLPHAPGYRAPQGAVGAATVHGQPELRQFQHQVGQKLLKALPGHSMRGRNSHRIAISPYHQVDRAMLVVPALRIK